MCSTMSTRLTGGRPAEYTAVASARNQANGQLAIPREMEQNVTTSSCPPSLVRRSSATYRRGPNPWKNCSAYKAPSDTRLELRRQPLPLRPRLSSRPKRNRANQPASPTATHPPMRFAYRRTKLAQATSSESLGPVLQKNDSTKTSKTPPGFPMDAGTSLSQCAVRRS